MFSHSTRHYAPASVVTRGLRQEMDERVRARELACVFNGKTDKRTQKIAIKFMFSFRFSSGLAVFFTDFHCFDGIVERRIDISAWAGAFLLLGEYSGTGKVV